MIRESVGAFDGWDVSARQRIPHFEIVLASANLAGVPPAPWKPSTQHLFKFVGWPTDITMLYRRKMGNWELSTPMEASLETRIESSVLMLTIPSAPQLPNKLAGMARPSFAEILIAIGSSTVAFT